MANNQVGPDMFSGIDKIWPGLDETLEDFDNCGIDASNISPVVAITKIAIVLAFINSTEKFVIMDLSKEEKDQQNKMMRCIHENLPGNCNVREIGRLKKSAHVSQPGDEKRYASLILRCTRP